MRFGMTEPRLGRPESDKSTHHQEAFAMLNVGDKAPDFEVLDHEGNTVRLSNYEGKTVVLWFYPRASTGG
jgi:peroxiredoxin